MTLPNYEYQCTACQHVFEIWQEVGAAAPACPECGATVKKVFHPPRVIFKGSGFYVTDLRAEKAGNSASAKSSGSTAASDKDANADASAKESSAKESAASSASEKTSAAGTSAATTDKAPTKSENSSPPSSS